jgi:hypothetical protein
MEGKGGGGVHGALPRGPLGPDARGLSMDSVPRAVLRAGAGGWRWTRSEVSDIAVAV